MSCWSELHRRIFETALADVICDVVLEVRRDLLGHCVLRLIAQQPNLQTIAIYTVIFSLLHESDAGDALCFIVSHARAIPTYHVMHERLPDKLQRVDIFDVAEVETQLSLVALVLEGGLNAMLEHHERGHLILCSFKIFEDLELVAVAKNLAYVRMRQAVPHLMEGNDVVEPGDFAAQLVIVFLGPLLLRSMIVDEFPDGPLDTLQLKIMVSIEDMCMKCLPGE